MCSFTWALIPGEHGKKLQNFVPFHQHQHGKRATKLVFKAVRAAQLSEGPQQNTPTTLSATGDHFPLYSRVFCVKATNTAEISTQLSLTQKEYCVQKWATASSVSNVSLRSLQMTLYVLPSKWKGYKEGRGALLKHVTVTCSAEQLLLSPVICSLGCPAATVNELTLNSKIRWMVNHEGLSSKSIMKHQAPSWQQKKEFD